jgi:hypothetical protein
MDVAAARGERRRMARQRRLQPFEEVVRQERRVAGDGEHHFPFEAKRRGEAAERPLQSRRVEKEPDFRPAHLPGRAHCHRDLVAPAPRPFDRPVEEAAASKEAQRLVAPPCAGLRRRQE